MESFLKHLIFSFYFFMVNVLSAQPASSISISFVPSFGDAPVFLNHSYYKNPEKYSIQIQTLKFYISQVELYREKELAFAEQDSYHLLDAADSKSLNLSLDVPNNVTFSHIKFNLGIDSLTNVSGAFGGDLDPTNGMYWTWQSGYINFKLEGVADVCPARNHFFQFHLGGYQAPFNSLQKVELKTGETKEIKINVAIDKLLAQIDLANNYQIMSPNQQAVEMAHKVSSIFSISK